MLDEVWFLQFIINVLHFDLTPNQVNLQIFHFHIINNLTAKSNRNR